MRLSFFIVDVFTEEMFSGNQLAVITNANHLSEETMQKIAREFNFSESTFIMNKHKRKNWYDVRIFTPVKEVPFAGHPTLGTAYVIQREVLGKPVGELVLNLEVGQIPVEITYRKKDPDILWMRQPPPRFGRVLTSDFSSDIIGLSPDDVDARFPVQEVSTGLPFVIVPLKTLSAVKSAKIQRDKLAKLLSLTKSDALLIFCPETYKKENNLNVRVFVNYDGVIEDSATGSANGCLAAYLVRNRYFKSDQVNLKVEQGYEMGRPSLILIKAIETSGKIDVSVGGRVRFVANGHLA